MTSCWVMFLVSLKSRNCCRIRGSSAFVTMFQRSRGEPAASCRVIIEREQRLECEINGRAGRPQLCALQWARASILLINDEGARGAAHKAM